MKASNKENKVKFYQKASFPWTIIAVAAVFSAGVAFGWSQHVNQQASINGEVNAAVATLKVEK